MAYTPKTWGTGDRVRTTDLNHIEQGISNAGSALIVDTNGQYTGGAGEFDYNETLNATFAEIYDTLADGTPVYIRRHIEEDGYSSDYTCCSALYSVLCAYKYNAEYRVYALSNAMWDYASKYALGKPTIVTFSASSPSSYPTAIANAAPNSVIDTWD